jgi:hypothetical protein
VILAFRQHDRRTTLLQRADDVVEDCVVSLSVRGEQLIDPLDRIVGAGLRQIELGLSHDEPVLERLCGRLGPWVHDVPSRAELHLDDRMLAVATLRGRRETGDIPRPNL